MAVEVSNGFKNMCKSNTPSGALGRIKVIEDDVTISENTDIQDLEIEDNCYVNDKFIGTTVAKKVKVNLFNDNNIYDLENKEIEAKLGFELNGSEELISYGNFIIEKPDTEEVQAKTNFVGYDYMIKFNKDFVDNNTYPVALGTYFSNLCAQVGVVAGNTTFINSNYMVQGNPFTNGEKCKEVLSAIAQIAGGIAKIGRDNKVYIISLSKGQPLEEIDGNNYDSFEPNNLFGPINKLIIKMNDGVDGEESVRSDSQSIAENGECAITISNNPILTSAEQRELVIDNIFDSIKGITYLPFKTSYYGYPYVDSTDKINILNVNDTTYASYIFNHRIKYDGAFSGNIETPALTKTQSMYQDTRDLKNWRRNTELKVDKIDGSISALVQTTETIITESIPNLQAQIDGAIQFWNGSAIPTLNNYPANEWTTEALRNNHRADIYTVIQDVQGELKQGKSYRFDKVNNTWQWIELTDNELSAVQALANSKAQVFYTTPTPPYNVDDLWLKDGKLYRCKTAKDNTGSYSANDWEEAVNYTDDTVANLAQLAAEAAQSTADGAVTAINNIADTTGQAEGKYIYIDDSADDTIISAKFNGERNQETRSGKNLAKNSSFTENLSEWSLNGLSNSNIETKFNQKCLHIQGALNTTKYVSQAINDRVEAGETYTISCMAYLENYVAGTTNPLCSLYFDGRDTNNNWIGTSRISGSSAFSEYTYNNNYVKIKYTFKVPNNADLTKTYGMYVYARDFTGDLYVYNLQLEQGSEDTAYEEYGISPSPDYPSEIKNLTGNLKIKVQNKNIFNKNATALSTYATKTVLDTGVRATSSTDGTYRYFGMEIGGSELLGKSVTISSIISPSSNNNGCVSLYYGDWRSYARVSAGATLNETGSYTKTLLSSFPEKCDRVYALFYSNRNGTGQTGDYVDYTNLQIKIGEATEHEEHEEHEEQTVYFPLAEGQKLYEGSYLADDGIHHTKGQIILTGTENWVKNNNVFQISGIVFPSNVALRTENTKAYSNMYKYAYYSSNITTNLQNNEFSWSGAKVFTIRDDNYSTATDWKIHLAELYANSTPVIVEYELAEPETVPYTAEQQEAWNQIKELMTYKNITHIYSDAYAEIKYVKDNGLDIYETKASAKVKYTETTERIAQIRIKEDRIEEEVGKTVTTVSNNYNELKTKFNDYAPISDVISLQTSVNRITEDTYTKTEINTKLTDGSVQKVSTTAGTFDSNGLTIEKTDAKTKGNFNEKGIKVMDATSGQDEELLFAGYDEELNETIVRTKNITVEKYLTLKDTARMEKYENPVLGGHGIGTFIL